MARHAADHSTTADRPASARKHPPFSRLDVCFEAPGHEQAGAEAIRVFTLYEEWRTVAHVLETRAEARLARGDREGALDDLARAADLAVTRLDSAELLARASTRIARSRRS